MVTWVIHDPPSTVMSASLDFNFSLSLSLEFEVWSLQFAVCSLAVWYCVYVYGGCMTAIVIGTVFILVMARGPGRSQGKIAE